MIVLDTNYLVRILIPDSDELERVSEWSQAGEVLATSAICWHEFCCGPVTDQERALVLSLLPGGIVPLQEEQAEQAARLFNAVSRPWSLRMDCLIAATAIVAKAQLATSNREDFAKFAAHGLILK